ncbi:MAG: GWxTD domain-containing protein, partial [Candidatus Krumholzibacteriaceae bacterium]
AKLPADELREYYGLQYIMSDSLKMEYLSLPTASERALWIERFWIGVDPTPTTEVNEARMEHTQRVAAARQFFGRADPPGWDDRGEILIRFGAPSFRTSIMGDVTAVGLELPQEYWYYDALNMSVTFTDINLMGRFTYATQERCLRAPGPPSPDGNGGPFTPREPDYIADPDIGMETSAMQPYRIWEIEGLKAGHAADNFYVYMDRYAALYSSDIQWAPLPCSYDIVSFRGGDKIDRTEVSFEVPAENRAAAGRGAARRADVVLGVLVRDDSLREVASGEDCIDIAPGAGRRTEQDLVPGQIVLALKPGHYHIGIEARETNSKRRAAFKTDVDIPPYASSPCISEVQFAAGIRETEENRRFQKGTLQIVPHPRHVYRIPAPIVFYFEIYGLDTDAEGKAFYRVEYRIIPLEKKRWGPVLQEAPANVGSALETSGYGSTQPQRLSIATNELWEGPFRLDVTVTDRRTFRTAAQSAKFSILK